MCVCVCFLLYERKTRFIIILSRTLQHSAFIILCMCIPDYNGYFFRSRVGRATTAETLTKNKYFIQIQKGYIHVYIERNQQLIDRLYTWVGAVVKIISLNANTE